MSTIETRVADARRHLRDTSIDGVQRRTHITKLEMRDAADGGYHIVGHGYVFNSLSENLGGFREQIAPGAGAGVLAKSHDIRALFNHDPNLLLAGTRNGTMTVAEDQAGGAYDAHVTPAMAETYYGRALRAMLAEGLVTQSSFAFRVASGGDHWEEDPGTGALIRTITEFGGLYDMSPVTYPAYPAADSGIRTDLPVTETESSALTSERDGNGPTAGERAVDGSGEDEQADDAPWRLRAVQRRIALRQAA